MNGIYDNGTHMLGQVNKIKAYNDKLCRDLKINEEQWLELAKELVWFDNYDIVSIYYDNGMGISIEKWKDSDRLEID